MHEIYGTLPSVIPTSTLKTLLFLIFGISFIGCSVGDKTETVIELECGNYLKVVSYGLTADTKRTYISTNPTLADTINEPYFRALDFFYKIEECTLVVYHADSLERFHLLNPKIRLDQRFTKEVDYSNYDSLGFDSILYQK